MGRDSELTPTKSPAYYFNPRAPYGARRHVWRRGRLGPEISIHAPRMGRDHCAAARATQQAISIHAPRMGRDAKGIPPPLLGLISIHAPRMGRDSVYVSAPCLRRRFQSTRPVWGATLPVCHRHMRRVNCNPRAPYGARLGVGLYYNNTAGFQSTRPVWGATRARASSPSAA